MSSYNLSVLWQEYQHKLQLLNPGGPAGFAPSVHYQQPNPFGGVTVPMGYYSNGFVQAGGNQTGVSLGSVLGGIASGLESIFHFPTMGTVGGTQLPAPVPTRAPDVPAPNQHPILTGAGGASGRGTAGAVATGTAIVGAVGGLVAPGLLGLGGHRARYAPAGTKGYHMIKKGPHAGLWTRNRHRNVANIRALRRALSRAHGFERICRKVIHFVSPHKKGRAVFRRRRRK